MTESTKIAKYLYISALVPMFIGGLVYAFANEFMPYHAIAVERQWEMLDKPLQVLIIAILNASGMLVVCNALAISFLLYFPFKHGEKWASWAMSFLGILTTSCVMASALYVDVNTQANPPWPALLIIIFFFVLALFFSIKQPLTSKQNQS